MNRRLLAALGSVATALALLPAVAARADTAPVPVQTGAVVSPAVHMDRSAPLSELVQQEGDHQGQHQDQDRSAKKLERRHGGQSSTPGVPSATSSSLAPGTLNNFLGVGNGFPGFSVASAPPDTNLAVGPNHIVEIVNSSFAVFTKMGATALGPVTIQTLFSGFGGGCQANNDGDPIVEYDSIADRWVISQFSVTTTPYLQCVAVSTSPDPTGSFNRYSFSYGNAFNDYPKLSVWPDAYYISFNIFTNGVTFAGAKACAYDRAKMLLGQPATQQCFNTSTTFGGLLPADLSGSRLPPAGSPGYFLALGAGTNDLAFWKFHTDWTTPANSTFTGPSTIIVPSYSAACNGGTCIPQSGTTNQLDSLADRLMYRLAYRNFGDHEALVVNHSVTAGSSTGVRWYELRSPGSTPTLFQSGTYAPDANHRWMGSIAIDQAGDMGLGFSVSGSGIHPQIHYTGRLASDPPGTMSQGEGTIIDGPGSQTGNLTRWGDYSAMSVDPVDDCTFWYANEYLPANGSFNWSTRIASFKFPTCAPAPPPNDFSISASPNGGGATQGTASSNTSTISTAITSGSAQNVSLSSTGAPAGAAVSFSPAAITSGGSSTMTVTTDATTPAGAFPITVTGTGTSATHTTTFTLTVTASDFSIAANPSTGSATQGTATSLTSTISTTVTSGNAQSVALSAAGAPTGTTVSFSPASVTGTGTSTMTVLTSASTPAGNFTITVTGTGSFATHSTSYTLAVVGPDDFSISASPSSLSIPQGGSGTSTISLTLTSGNPQSVNLSAAGQPTGVTVAFSPTSVTGTGTSTMTVSVDVSTAPSTYAITVTGTGTTATHSTSVTLTVPPNDFSIAASPASLSVAQGGSGSSSISTTLTSGNAQTVNLSASGQPAGVAVSFGPASITGSGSSTMTVSVAMSVTPGPYTITVTGTGTSAMHTTSVALTVTAAVTGGITNGGFETGTLSGWTSVGITAVVNTGAHGGTYAARVGGTSPTNGDSSIAQTFTVPTGSGTLSFWYKVVCPDTITYDWATATLRDNTTGGTSTPLAKVCSNTGAWAQVTTTVVAGHSYTLTLISHDDNYVGDPTYTLYDDVALASPPPPPPPPPSGITNGGFETGTLSGWTRGGAASSVTTVAHSGTYAAMLGGTSPTSGDSTLSQTFTAGTGATRLSLWYAMNCPDTITYDWMIVTLKDNTTNTTATVVSKRCAATYVWTNATANVVAGHSYTLTLLSHDDNYVGDATYTLFDDITLA